MRQLSLPDLRVYAWVGGEAMTIAPIRRYLRKDLGLPKEDVEVVGYWRRPKAADAQRSDRSDNAGSPTPAHSAEGAETSAEVLHDVHEMTELGPPVVTRAAATLGIAPTVAQGTTTLEGIARETGVEPALLRPLLDAMCALGLLERDGDHHSNTARGGVLMEDSVLEKLSLDDPANRDALALADLVDVLRSGSPSARVGTTPWHGRRETDRALDTALQDRTADQLQFVVGPLARTTAVSGARTLAVVGDAAPFVASHLAQGRTVHLPGTAEPEWPVNDCTVLVSALEGRSDEEALGLLRCALAASPVVVLAERASDKAPSDDHAAEYALTSLTITGSPLRTRDRISALLRSAGASTVDTTTLGWGFGPFGTVTVAHA